MSWVNQIQHPRPLYMYLLYGADQLRDDILRLTAKLQIELNLKIKTIHLVFMPFLFYQILENFPSQIQYLCINTGFQNKLVLGSAAQSEL